VTNSGGVVVAILASADENNKVQNGVARSTGIFFIRSQTC